MCQRPNIHWGAPLVSGPEARPRADDILSVNADIYLDIRRQGAVQFMQNPDERMLEGLQDLDPQVIGVIYDEYFPDVYRYVRYRLDDPHTCEDIASDVFVRLLEAAQNRRAPQTNLKGWLIATASHIVTDNLRSQYRRPVETLPEDLLDQVALPRDEFDRREQARQFRAAFALLTAEQQHVLTLRFGVGNSLEETAGILKKKVNAVKALQFRALAALQRNIGEQANE